MGRFARHVGEGGDASTTLRLQQFAHFLFAVGVEAAIALLPPPRGRPAATPVTTTQYEDTSVPALALFDDDRGGPNVSE